MNDGNLCEVVVSVETLEDVFLFILCIGLKFLPAVMTVPCYAVNHCLYKFNSSY